MRVNKTVQPPSPDLWILSKFIKCIAQAVNPCLLSGHLILLVFSHHFRFESAVSKAFQLILKS